MEITDAQDRQIEIEYLASYIPRTIMAPFSSGNIIGVVILVLCTGATLRRLRGKQTRVVESCSPSTAH